jgi:hypothetical protein
MSKVALGEPVRFQLVARDGCGNACGYGGQQFSVRVRAPLSAARQPDVRVVDNGDGTHDAEFMPTVRGKHEVSAMLGNDEHITVLGATEHVVAVV